MSKTPCNKFGLQIIATSLLEVPFSWTNSTLLHSNLSSVVQRICTVVYKSVVEQFEYQERCTSFPVSFKIASASSFSIAPQKLTVDPFSLSRSISNSNAFFATENLDKLFLPITVKIRYSPSCFCFSFFATPFWQPPQFNWVSNTC